MNEYTPTEIEIITQDRARTRLFQTYILPLVHDGSIRFPKRIQMIGGGDRSSREALLMQRLFNPNEINCFETRPSRTQTARSRWSQYPETTANVSFITASLRRQHAKGGYDLTCVFNVDPRLTNEEDVQRLIEQTEIGGAILITTWLDGDAELLKVALMNPLIRDRSTAIYSCEELFDLNGKTIPQESRMQDRTLTLLKRVA